MASVLRQAIPTWVAEVGGWVAGSQWLAGAKSWEMSKNELVAVETPCPQIPGTCGLHSRESLPAVFL